MHELGITQEIIDIVTRHAKGAQVRRVVLEIGVLSAILPDAIRFCFDLCSRDTVAEGAELEIKETAARARCSACGREFTVEQPIGCCPCGGIDLEWLSGDELRITQMEVS